MPLAKEHAVIEMPYKLRDARLSKIANGGAYTVNFSNATKVLKDFNLEARTDTIFNFIDDLKKEGYKVKSVEYSMDMKDRHLFTNNSKKIDKLNGWSPVFELYLNEKSFEKLGRPLVIKKYELEARFTAE